jgi:hypothetical protein
VSPERWTAWTLTIETAAARTVESNPSMGSDFTALPAKNRHNEACIDGPGEDSESREQRCFPSRRQQAGSLDSGSEANIAGSISEKLKRASSATASTLRTS